MRTKRKLIKSKKIEGDFMKYLAAYVRAKESWVVFSGQTIIQDNLTEEDASTMCYLLNTAEWMGAKNLKEQAIEEKRSFDFEKVYEIYPRKIGKKLGLQRLYAKVKSEEKYKLLLGAVEAYKDYCDNSIKEEKYIKHFSSWVNEWEDWITGEITETYSLPFDQLAKAVQL